MLHDKNNQRDAEIINLLNIKCIFLLDNKILKHLLYFDLAQFLSRLLFRQRNLAVIITDEKKENF